MTSRPLELAVLLAGLVLLATTEYLVAANALPRCDPGYFLNLGNGSCTECINGSDFTDEHNRLDACVQCEKCNGGGKIVNIACTTTRNAVCGCRQGEYLHVDGCSPLPGAAGNSTAELDDIKKKLQELWEVAQSCNSSQSWIFEQLGGKIERLKVTVVKELEDKTKQCMDTVENQTKQCVDTVEDEGQNLTAEFRSWYPNFETVWGITIVLLIVKTAGILLTVWRWYDYLLGASSKKAKGPSQTKEFLAHRLKRLIIDPSTRLEKVLGDMLEDVRKDIGVKDGGSTSRTDPPAPVASPTGESENVSTEVTPLVTDTDASPGGAGASAGPDSSAGDSTSPTNASPPAAGTKATVVSRIGSIDSDIKQLRDTLTEVRREIGVKDDASPGGAGASAGPDSSAATVVSRIGSIDSDIKQLRDALKTLTTSVEGIKQDVGALKTLTTSVEGIKQHVGGPTPDDGGPTAIDEPLAATGAPLANEINVDEGKPQSPYITPNRLAGDKHANVNNHDGSPAKVIIAPGFKPSMFKDAPGPDDSQP